MMTTLAALWTRILRPLTPELDDLLSDLDERDLLLDLHVWLNISEEEPW